MKLFYNLLFLFAFSFDAAFGHKKMTPSMMIPGECLDTDVPYHVDVRYDGKHKCSGSLVKSEKGVLVVTAASCVRDGGKDKYSLSLFTGPKGVEQKLSIIDIKTYEKFDVALLNYDIAVITVDQAIDKKSEFLDLPPVAMEWPEEIERKRVDLIAWDVNKNCMRQLKDNNFVEADICQEIMESLEMPISSSMVCSGYGIPPPNIDYDMTYKCQGELGSPLVMNLYSKLRLLGVISWTPEQPESKDEVHNYPCVSTGLLDKDIIEWISKQ